MATWPEFMRFRAGLLSDVPRLPGLLDMPPQPQEAPQQPQGRPGGFGRALGTIFGGQDDPRLSPEENERQRKAAMIQSGLGILASKGSGLSGIAEGALYGQQAGMAGRQGAYDMQQQQAAQQTISGAFQGGGDILPRLYKAYEAAAASGNTQLATSLATIIQAREASQRGSLDMPNLVVKEGVNPDTGKSEQYAFDPRTGEKKWMGVRPDRAPRLGDPEYFDAMRDLEQMRAGFRTQRLPGGPAAERAATELTALGYSLDTIERTLQANPEAAGIKGLLPDVVLKRIDPEGREFRAAKAEMVSAIRLARSGAAVSKYELPVLDGFLPSRDDRAEDVLIKLNNLREWIANKQRAMGVTGNGGGPTQPQVDDPFADLVPR